MAISAAALAIGTLDQLRDEMRTELAALDEAVPGLGGLAISESSPTNADDRLSPATLGRIESRDGIVAGRDVAEFRRKPSVTRPLHALPQLGTIGFDNEIDRQAVGGPRLGRSDDGHQRSPGSNQTRGPPLDVAA